LRGVVLLEFGVETFDESNLIVLPRSTCQLLEERPDGQRLVGRPFLRDIDSGTLRIGGATEALFQATQGIPRKVNRLAHYALTSAALDKAQTITIDHVQNALEELRP
jgi:hypothetical protein